MAPLRWQMHTLRALYGQRQNRREALFRQHHCLEVIIMKRRSNKTLEAVRIRFALRIEWQLFARWHHSAAALRALRFMLGAVGLGLALRITEARRMSLVSRMISRAGSVRPEIRCNSSSAAATPRL